MKRKADDEGDDERAQREETDEPRVGVKRKSDDVNDDMFDKHQKQNDDAVNIDKVRIGLKLI